MQDVENRPSNGSDTIIKKNGNNILHVYGGGSGAYGYDERETQFGYEPIDTTTITGSGGIGGCGGGGGFWSGEKGTVNSINTNGTGFEGSVGRIGEIPGVITYAGGGGG
jgi:hypothetical protein